MAFVKGTVQQQAAADQVDAPGDALAELVYQREHRLAEGGITAPADDIQPVQNIGLGFFRRQRAQMAGRHDPLVHLLQFRAQHQLPQFRLAQQEDLHQGLAVDLDIGQQAQFFHGGYRQVLGLVDNEQGAQAVAMPAAQLLGQPLQDFALLDIVQGHAELVGDHLQQVVGLELAADQVGNAHVLAGKVFNQSADQGGLAGTGPAGDHDKAFLAHKSKGHIGTRLRVALVGIGEGVIRAQQERFGLEAVKLVIHCDSLPRCRKQMSNFILHGKPIHRKALPAFLRVDCEPDHRRHRQTFAAAACARSSTPLTSITTPSGARMGSTASSPRAR